MVNYLVWGLFLTTNAHASVNANQSESRFVEVIIRDLEEPEFIRQIEDKVILFPNELRAVLEKGGPKVNLKTTEDHKPRIRRSYSTDKWNKRKTARYEKIQAIKQRKQQLKMKQLQRKQQLSGRRGSANPNPDREGTYTFGGWTSWSSWSSCSATCGNGYRNRRRFCANASIGSDACPGLSNESMPCGGGACEEFEWTNYRYTECSKTCGGGQTTATRGCKVKGTNREVDSRSCVGARTAVYACNTQRCNVGRVEYEWDSYRYSACDASCGGGKQWGMRRCVMKGTNRAVDNKFCGENNTLRRDCNTQPCQNYRNAPKPSLKASRAQCGVKPGYGNQKSPVQLRIAGGTIAEDGDWPWQVSLQHRSCKKSNHFGSNCNWKHMCGASIVDKKWIVTAAHCIEESGYYTNNNDPGDDWAVVIGMDKLNYDHDGKNNGKDGKRFLLKRIIPHPDYVFTYITHSDVALLELREEIEYSETVRPICLPNGRQPSHGERCHITGWGYTHGKGEVLSHHLRQATIPMVNFKQCQNTGIWYRLLKEKVHMCGGDSQKGGVDSCGGDSGGPLACYDSSSESYYLAGVTSFGFSDCGKRGHLGIYARMINFEDWVRRTIETSDGDDFDEYEPFYGGYQYYNQYKSLASIKSQNVYG